MKWKIGFAVAALFSFCTAVCGQDVSIRPDHPRIWLDKEIVEKLRSDKGVVTPLTRDKTGILSNALAHVISGDKEAGRKAVSEAKELLPDIIPSLGRWEGWTRTLVHQVAICYDWCHDLLSDEEKKEFVRVLNEVAGWCNQKSRIESPYNSYFYGYMWSEAVIGLATYPENPEAGKWVSHARIELFEKRALPALDEMGGTGSRGTANTMDHCSCAGILRRTRPPAERICIPGRLS